MKHEKIYKLEDGSKLQVTADLWVDSMSSKGQRRWTFSAYLCPKGKRTFTRACGLSHDDFQYRGMTMSERSAHNFKAVRDYVGDERLKEVANELIESLKLLSLDDVIF